jgi:hypothetical protein
MNIADKFLLELQKQKKEQKKITEKLEKGKEMTQILTEMLQEETRAKSKKYNIITRSRSKLDNEIENEIEMAMLCNEDCELDAECKIREALQTDEDEDDMPEYQIEYKDDNGHIKHTNSILDFNQMTALISSFPPITKIEKDKYEKKMLSSDPFNVFVGLHGKKDYNKWIFNPDQIISSFYFAKNGDIAFSSPMYISGYAPLIIEYLERRRGNGVLTISDRDEILKIIKETELKMATSPPASGKAEDLLIWFQRMSDTRPISSNVIATIGEYERIGKTYLLFPNMAYVSKFYSVNGDSKPRGMIVCKDKIGDLKQLLEYLISKDIDTRVDLSELLKFLKSITDLNKMRYTDSLNTQQIDNEITLKSGNIKIEKYIVLNSDELIQDPQIRFRIPLYIVKCTGKTVVVLSEILFMHSTDDNAQETFLDNFFKFSTVYNSATHDTPLDNLQKTYDPNTLKIIYYKNMNLLCCDLLIKFLETIRTPQDIDFQFQISLAKFLTDIKWAIPNGVKIRELEEEMVQKLYKSEFLYFCKLLQILYFIMVDMSCEGAIKSNTPAIIRRAITQTLTNPTGIVGEERRSRGGSKNKKIKRKTQKKRKRKTNKKRKPRKFISKNYNYK